MLAPDQAGSRSPKRRAMRVDQRAGGARPPRRPCRRRSRPIGEAARRRVGIGGVDAPSSSSDEIASARISCSDRSSKRFCPLTNHSIGVAHQSRISLITRNVVTQPLRRANQLVNGGSGSSPLRQAIDRWSGWISLRRFAPRILLVEIAIASRWGRLAAAHGHGGGAPHRSCRLSSPVLTLNGRG